MNDVSGLRGCLDIAKKHGMLMHQSPYMLSASSQAMFDIPRKGFGNQTITSPLDE
jgi:hypothetical protein